MKKKTLSNRQLKFLLMLGPSGMFLAVYMLISMLFVNTTDRHMLSTNREMVQYHAPFYHRAINFIHEKMLFVTDRKPKPHVTHSVPSDSSAANVMKPARQEKY